MPRKKGVSKTVVGKRMAAIRGKRDVTQQAAADATGVALVTWRSWELGNRTPDGPSLAKIAETLACKPAELTDDPLLIVSAWISKATRKDVNALISWVSERFS